MIQIGFTGTQKGMTFEQRLSVKGLLQDREFIAHHGDCVGADETFDELCRLEKGCRSIHIHPCNLTTKRAYCDVRPGIDHLYAVKPPLQRNKDIVAQVDLLIATPGEETPQRRSGTWATIRYAQNSGLRFSIHIVMPSGIVVEA